MSATTGIFVLDVVLRPFIKLGLKFPIIGLLVLASIYGFIAYVVLKSAYMAERY